tara:strand:+ start:130 stop:417 length:288 start_codon:yes stop_codon:yes gene_type:complete
MVAFNSMSQLNSNDFCFFIKKNKMNFTRPTIAFFFALSSLALLNSCGGASACDCKANDLMGEAADTEMQEKCKEAENNMTAAQKAEFIASYKNCK